MPELPEVETVRRHLQTVLPGLTLATVALRRADLRYPIPVAAVQALVGAQVCGIRRRAKYLLLDLSPPPGLSAQTALVHLGMSGRLFVEPLAEAAPPAWQTHEHWRWTLTGPQGARLLRYVDARRFGALDVHATADEAGHPLLAALGPEPFDSSGFSAKSMFAATRGLRSPVKAWLMDSHRVVGIGNIYASEACWRARIHPLRPATTLSEADCKALVTAARSVLEDAIAAGGSTLRDFVGGDAAPGYFQQSLDVYDRAGQACTRCTGDRRRKQVPVIERCVFANRATYFCTGCQKT